MGCAPAYSNASMMDFDWAMAGVGVPADKGKPSKAMTAAQFEAAVSRAFAHAGK